MRRMLVMLGSAILGCLFLVVIALMIVFVSQPTSYRIARSRTLAVPPSAVLALVSDLRAFEAIGPHIGPPDPSRTLAFSPISTGEGAWVDVTEEGSTARLTITHVSSDLVEMLSQRDGGAEPATFRVELRPSGTGTEVTLVVENELHGIGRLLWPVADLEGLVAPNMEDTLVRIERGVSH